MKLTNLYRSLSLLLQASDHAEDLSIHPLFDRRRCGWTRRTFRRATGILNFERLNRVLADCGFDAFVEELCAAFYADRLGRPSLRPGRYFRMLFIGYFEGLTPLYVKKCLGFSPK